MRLASGPEVADWVCARTGTCCTDKTTAIGVSQGDSLIAGAAFDGYTGTRITVHLVVKDPSASTLLGRAILRYTFLQLGCSALTLSAERSNIAAVSLHSRLDAIPEGILVGASRSGDDILLARLERSSPLVQRMLHGKRRR